MDAQSVLNLEPGSKPSSQSASHSRRLSFIDGLRGVGASAVVLYHLAGRTSGAWLTHHGYLGVAIFFVLSGFVITASIGPQKITRSFAWRFAARRAVRLDPLYWTSILLAIILAALAAHFGFDQHLPTASATIAHLFYLQDLLGMPAISSVYWTLCLEVQFYLFLLVLLWLRERIKPLFPALFLLLVVLSLVEQSNLANLTPNGFFLPYWAAFAFGVMIYWISVDELHPGYLAAALALALGFMLGDHADWHLASVCTAVAIYAAWKFKRMSTWLSGPVMQFLGRISYSLYLLHPLIGWTAMSVALRIMNEWLALCVGLLASLASAWIAYRLIERPSVRLSRMISMGAAVPAQA